MSYINVQIKRLFLCFCNCLPFVIIVVTGALSYPHKGDLVQLRQPNNTYVPVRIWGDEFYQRVESLSGYSLVRNTAGWICYATISNDSSSFLPTHLIYTGIDDEYISYQAISKNLILSSKTVQESVASMQATRGFNPKERFITLQHTGMNPISLERTITGLVVLIDFSDEPATIEKSQITDFFNLEGYTGFGNTGSIRDYFIQVSRKKLDYRNVITGYYRAEHPKKYYDDPLKSHNQTLLVEACNTLIKQGFDFSTISCDKNGVILSMTILHAGMPEIGWAKGLWPCFETLKQPLVLGNGLKVAYYQMASIGQELNSGSICHECGHMVCHFPDQYEYIKDPHVIYGSNLMGSGISKSPTAPSAYLCFIRGWGGVDALTSEKDGIVFIRSPQTNPVSHSFLPAAVAPSRGFLKAAVSTVRSLPSAVNQLSATPNPAISGTMMRFILPFGIASGALFIILDAVGDEVKRFLILDRPPSITWDLTNSQGRKVGPGSYLCLLRCTDISGNQVVFKLSVGIIQKQ